MTLYTLLTIAVILIVLSIKIVPQQQSWIVERFGKFRVNLQAGLNFIIPFVDRVAYRHSLKETAFDIPAQSAITQDNVNLTIDGIVYLKVVDPVAASYGVSDAYFALTQLAQTTMRSEIGKITLDRTFEEREALNHNIVENINEAATTWGVQCMRYEIKDINPPDTVIEAMELQVAAERKKRAQILDSEGDMQAQINVAEGQKRKVVLESEAAMTDQVNRANGEADAILSISQATAKGFEVIAVSLAKEGAGDAVSYRVAEKYIEAFEKLAKTNNTILLPSNVGDASSMVAQIATVFDKIKSSNQA
jgi:regulator of protease activity HflC (stomatin/prohibitin superfamily)